jgi:hypothetical protein
LRRILIFQILITICTFFSAIIFPTFIIFGWEHAAPIYTCIAVYQIVLPEMIQHVIVIRAYMKRNLQKEINYRVKPKFTQQLNKIEKNFVYRFAFIVAVRMLKFSLGHYYWYFLFNCQTMFAEVIYLSNELMFSYFVESLIGHLEHVNCKVKMIRNERDLRNIKRDIVEILRTKMMIEQRYSIDLWLTISYNFILNIISIYFTIIRLIFSHFRVVSDYSTYTHFLVPFMAAWTTFSSCEKFHKKVKNI